MRATRDLLRRRTKIVRHGANLNAHVSNMTSQYNLPPNKVNLKNICARKQLNSAFPDPVVQRNIDLDMAILDAYAKEVSKVEWLAKQHNPIHLKLLKTVHGIGSILSLTMLYEIGNINRFESVQNFASYSRLVECEKNRPSFIIGSKTRISVYTSNTPKPDLLIRHPIGVHYYD